MTRPTAPCLCLTAHAVEKFTQFDHLVFNDMLARVALDDNRLIKQELAALGVVTPYSPALRKGGRPAEQSAKHIQRFLDPIRLIDWRLLRSLLGMNSTSNADAALLAPKTAGEIWHVEDLRFFTFSIRLSARKVKRKMPLAPCSRLC